MQHSVISIKITPTASQWGATRGLVDEYLCIDGRPIYTGGNEGNYEQNPNFLGYGKWTELENRDPRLTQTIWSPGRTCYYLSRRCCR